MNYLSVLNKNINLANSINFNNKYISINRKCNLNHWNSYFDKKKNIQIMILGRPVIEVSDWSKFSQNEESFITKFLIEKYVNLEINEFCNQLNGAFTLLVLDYNLNKILIVTDKLGIFPVYTYGGNDLKKIQISSNFKILKDNLSQQLDLDKVSIAEFLKKGFIYHPNTFFKEIKTLDSGSYCVLDFQKKKILNKKYFEIKANLIYDFDYLTNKLSKALVKSIKKRTLKYFGKKGVFLSGGSDSRMILANVDDKNIEAITLYNNENHEIKTTKNIAKLLDIKHQLIKRDFDYYFNSFENSIDINGGRSLPTDDHFLNLKDNETINTYDTILTGCYADWLFKGIALNRKQFTFLYKKIPIYKLKPFNYNFFSKRTLLKSQYEEMIKEREDQIFLNKKIPINIEIGRLFPLFQEETSATRLTLQQIFPWDSIFADNEVIEVYQQIPVEYKINSEVYDKAISLILNKVKKIPHANKKHKIGINKYNGAIIYLFSNLINKVLKTIRVKKINSVTGDGSWISHKEYAKSQNIKNLWMNIEFFNFYKEILDLKDFDYKEIIKNDYKLIYKCIVLDKILKNAFRK